MEWNKRNNFFLFHCFLLFLFYLLPCLFLFHHHLSLPIVLLLSLQIFCLLIFNLPSSYFYPLMQLLCPAPQKHAFRIWEVYIITCHVLFRYVRQRLVLYCRETWATSPTRGVAAAVVLQFRGVPASHGTQLWQQHDQQHHCAAGRDSLPALPCEESGRAHGEYRSAYYPSWN